LNKENSDSIKNFENISSINYETEINQIKSTLKAKLSEGSVYRVIVHAISVLKQIQRLCEFAIDNPEDYPNTNYYEELLAKINDAMELINKEPIKMETI
jgi:hypothetical protein